MAAGTPGLENLRQDIREREGSDKILSTAWVLLPILASSGVIFSAAILIATFYIGFPQVGLAGLGFGSIGIAAMVLTILGGFLAHAYLGYTLINRRNKHFKRQSRFYEDLVTHVRGLASKKGVDIEAGLSPIERTVREMKADEGEKSAVLWLILVLIIASIPLLYILYFLTKDFGLHERRENGLIEDCNKSLESLGITISVGTRRSDPIPQRSFVLYLILSIVTFGLFGIYWLYTLIVDPNNHFKHHVQYEDELMSKLESSPAI